MPDQATPTDLLPPRSIGVKLTAAILLASSALRIVALVKGFGLMASAPTTDWHVIGIWLIFASFALFDLVGGLGLAIRTRWSRNFATLALILDIVAYVVAASVTAQYGQVPQYSPMLGFVITVVISSLCIKAVRRRVTDNLQFTHTAQGIS
ncbi:MAG: hypothetical protein JWM57_1984 [Phycisphaerales bacterium]|nr:hypothetical protein [Phycisphaerales bacterium]